MLEQCLDKPHNDFAQKAIISSEAAMALSKPRARGNPVFAGSLQRPARLVKAVMRSQKALGGFKPKEILMLAHTGISLVSHPYFLGSWITAKAGLSGQHLYVSRYMMLLLL